LSLALTIVQEQTPEVPKGDKGERLKIKNIQPNDKRAINYLVNEYLKDQKYQLTSISFSEEVFFCKCPYKG
jgi:hypothetical protein